jgi:hypothetical protein
VFGEISFAELGALGFGLLVWGWAGFEFLLLEVFL